MAIEVCLCTDTVVRFVPARFPSAVRHSNAAQAKPRNRKPRRKTGAPAAQSLSIGHTRCLTQQKAAKDTPRLFPQERPVPDKLHPTAAGARARQGPLLCVARTAQKSADPVSGTLLDATPGAAMRATYRQCISSTAHCETHTFRATHTHTHEGKLHYKTHTFFYTRRTQTHSARQTHTSRARAHARVVTATIVEVSVVGRIIIIIIIIIIVITFIVLVVVVIIGYGYLYLHYNS